VRALFAENKVRFARAEQLSFTNGCLIHNGTYLTLTLTLTITLTLLTLPTPLALILSTAVNKAPVW